jgi:hypothetical protein
VRANRACLCHLLDEDFFLCGVMLWQIAHNAPFFWSPRRSFPRSPPPSFLRCEQAKAGQDQAYADAERYR